MFSLLKFWVRNSQPVHFTGARLDERSAEDKKDDVHFSQIVATANEPVWKEKKLETARMFPVLNQWQSFTCGANAMAKALGILFFTKYGTYLPFSREHIYQRRENIGSPGMALYDMFLITGKGTTLEQFKKGTGLVDSDYDTLVLEEWMKDVGKSFATTKGVYLDNDMETIASVIQTTGKGVILLTYFLAGEWSKEIPYISDFNLDPNEVRSLRHFVVAVDAILVGGKKYLVIEDSSHFGGYSRRLVSEDWVLRRVIGAGYPMRFKFQEGTGVKPVYDGITVISAQTCLRYEGLFPANVDYFESVGPTTRMALGAFQTKYKLKVTQALDQATKNQLSRLYP